MGYGFSKRLYIVSFDCIDTAVCQGIFCQLAALCPLGFISVHIIRKRPFTLAIVPFPINHTIALQCGECRGQVCANSIAALGPACNDVYHIGYAVAITYARIVYEVYFAISLGLRASISCLPATMPLTRSCTPPLLSMAVTVWLMLSMRRLASVSFSSML